MSQRILCVQLADIGDLVLTTPALQVLRTAVPDAHIALLTTPHAAPVVRDAETPPVDEIITFDKHTFDRPRALLNPGHWRTLFELWQRLDRGVFDTVVFFHHMSTRFGALKFAGMAVASGAGRRIGLRGRHTPFLNDGLYERGFGALHQAKYWLRLAEIAAGERGKPSYVQNGDYVRPQGTPPVPLPDGLRVAVHAGSGGYSMARRWEPEKFAAVAGRLIHERDAHIVLVGTDADDTAAVREQLPDEQVTDLTGQTTLGELSAVLGACDLFIGADSGVMHLAAASGVPVVAVFGPSNDAAWQPWTTTGQHIVVRTEPICAPCSYVGTGVGLRDGCAARTCMKMVTPGMVYTAAAQLLDGDDRPAPTGSRRTRDTRNRVRILGVPVDKLTYDDLLAQIGAWIDTDDGRTHQLCTVNPEFVMMAQGDPNFYNILNRVDLCLADGVGLLYAARWLGEELPARVTGSDGVPAIAERAATEGWRIYLLGAAEGVAERAADALRQRYPDLQIAGTYSGSPRAEDEDAIVARVNAANADILLVAYGAPAQDKWIARNAPRLNVRVAMGVGGTFDYLAGDAPMAPDWMRDAGLEWLYRLIKQPWRARRQLRLPAFVLAVLLRGRRGATASG